MNSDPLCRINAASLKRFKRKIEKITLGDPSPAKTHIEGRTYNINWVYFNVFSFDDWNK